MNTKTFKFQGKYYTSNQGWGLYHPKYNYWYDPSCIMIDNDVATLDISATHYESKNFGAGQMVSKRHYLYGTFEWSYLLPKGKNLWPAIWLTGAELWPPEIDVMEGLTSKGYFIKGKPDYKRFIGFNNIVPGLFYGTQDNLKRYCKASLGSQFTFSCLQPIDKVNTCKLEWTPDYIKMYYNGKLVSKITNKTILKEFDKPMIVVMNNAVTDEFTNEDYTYYKQYGRPFSIINFNYTYYEG